MFESFHSNQIDYLCIKFILCEIIIRCGETFTFNFFYFIIITYFFDKITSVTYLIFKSSKRISRSLASNTRYSPFKFIYLSIKSSSCSYASNTRYFIFISIDFIIITIIISFHYHCFSISSLVSMASVFLANSSYTYFLNFFIDNYT